MKKIFLITLLAIGMSSFAQKDTIIQEETGFNFEMSNKSMSVIINNDTIVSALLFTYKNRLAWGENPYYLFVEYTLISDSIVFLFKNDFESIILFTGIKSFEDNYGIYTLKEIFINYVNDIGSITATYSKQLKAPNGMLTDVFTENNIELTEIQIEAFKQLLLSDQVKALYLDWYNEILGNN